MGPIWGLQDPGGPHVGPMNFAIWGVNMKVISDLLYIDFIHCDIYGRLCKKLV